MPELPGCTHSLMLLPRPLSPPICEADKLGAPVDMLPALTLTAILAAVAAGNALTVGET